MQTQTIVLRRAKAGDATELATIYGPLIHSMARALGLRREDAEDVRQQVLLEVLQALPRFEYDRSRGSFRGFLKKIVRERAADLRRRRTSAGELDESAVVAEDELEARFEEEWIQAHVQGALERVRREVQPATFQAFELLVIRSVPVAEAAARLGQTPNQVCQNKLRVTRRLRARLQEMLDEV